MEQTKYIGASVRSKEAPRHVTGRGRYEVDRDQLLKLINEATRDNPQMKINTIQFVYTDPLDTLKSISEKTGGIHTFITEADLGLQ